MAYALLPGRRPSLIGAMRKLDGTLRAAARISAATPRFLIAFGELLVAVFPTKTGPCGRRAGRRRWQRPSPFRR
ncbi:hypothetical protein [Salipiger mangrovisoli]|nr:hypothetical protein [Salipiger mangrovisoli]